MVCTEVKIRLAEEAGIALLSAVGAVGFKALYDVLNSTPEYSDNLFMGDCFRAGKQGFIASLMVPSVFNFLSYLHTPAEKTTSLKDVVTSSFFQATGMGLSFVFYQYIDGIVFCDEQGITFGNSDIGYDHWGIWTGTAYVATKELLPKYAMYHSLKLISGYDSIGTSVVFAMLSGVASSTATDHIVNMHNGDKAAVDLTKGTVTGLNYAMYMLLSDSVFGKYYLPMVIESVTEFAQSESGNFLIDKLIYEAYEAAESIIVSLNHIDDNLIRNDEPVVSDLHNTSDDLVCKNEFAESSLNFMQNLLVCHDDL